MGSEVTVPRKHQTRERVRAYVQRHPCAKVRDIQAACDLSSTSQVAHHLKMIEREGSRALSDEELVTENVALRKKVRELEAKLARIRRDLAKHF